MGTFLDPLGGTVPAQDVITHDAGQASHGGTTGNNVYITDPVTGLPVSMTAAQQVFQSFTFLNVAPGLATTTFKTGAGTFGGFSVNTAGTTNTLTFYDSLTGSGTKIGTYTTAAQVSLALNYAFTTGLTAVSAGGTGADYTVGFL